MLKRNLVPNVDEDTSSKLSSHPSENNLMHSSMRLRSPKHGKKSSFGYETSP